MVLNCFYLRPSASSAFSLTSFPCPYFPLIHRMPSSANILDSAFGFIQATFKWGLFLLEFVLYAFAILLDSRCHKSVECILSSPFSPSRSAGVALGIHHSVPFHRCHQDHKAQFFRAAASYFVLVFS